MADFLKQFNNALGGIKEFSTKGTESAPSKSVEDYVRDVANKLSTPQPQEKPRLIDKLVSYDDIMKPVGENIPAQRFSGPGTLITGTGAQEGQIQPVQDTRRFQSSAEISSDIAQATEDAVRTMKNVTNFVGSTVKKNPALNFITTAGEALSEPLLEGARDMEQRLRNEFQPAPGQNLLDKMISAHKENPKQFDNIMLSNAPLLTKRLLFDPVTTALFSPVLTGVYVAKQAEPMATGGRSNVIAFGEEKVMQAAQWGFEQTYALLSNKQPNMHESLKVFFAELAGESVAGLALKGTAKGARLGTLGVLAGTQKGASMASGMIDRVKTEAFRKPLIEAITRPDGNMYMQMLPISQITRVIQAIKNAEKAYQDFNKMSQKEAVKAVRKELNQIDADTANKTANDPLVKKILTSLESDGKKLFDEADLELQSTMTKAFQEQAASLKKQAMAEVKGLLSSRKPPQTKKQMVQEVLQKYKDAKVALEQASVNRASTRRGTGMLAEELLLSLTDKDGNQLFKDLPTPDSNKYGLGSEIISATTKTVADAVDNLTSDDFTRIYELTQKAIEEDRQIRNGKFARAGDADYANVRTRKGFVVGITDAADAVIKAPFKATANLVRRAVPEHVKWAGDVAVNTLKESLPESVKKGLSTLNKLNSFLFKEQQNLKKEVFDDAILPLKQARQRLTTQVGEVLEEFKTIPKEQIQPASEYLAGKRDVDLPTETKLKLQGLRDMIDIEGMKQVLAGNLGITTFASNMGSYMRRLYKAHNLNGYNPTAEKYTNLVDTLIESRGMSMEMAEQAVVDIMYGHFDKYVPQKATSGLKTGGAFTKKRKLGDDPVSMAIRDFLGEVRDPAYLVERTLHDLSYSEINYRFLEQIQKIEGAVVDKVSPVQYKKYKPLEGKGWGPLEGKYMDKEIFQYFEKTKPLLSSMLGDDLARHLNEMNNFIKKNLTTRNVAGQVRNVTGSASTSLTLLGFNYFSFSGLLDLKDAINSFKIKDAFYQELKAYGRLGDTSKIAEMGKLIDAAIDGGGRRFGKIGDIYKWLDDKSSKMYEMGDMMFMMANYKKLRAKGMNPLEAITEANRATPDYSRVNPFIKKLRSEIIGVPFLTWRYKMYPEIAKAIFTNPTRSALPVTTMFAGAFMMMKYSNIGELTPEEQQMIMTQLFRDGKIPMFRNEQGEIESFDFGRYTPYADSFRGAWTKKGEPTAFLPDWLQGYFQGISPGIGSFPIANYMNIRDNYDPFLQRQIWDDELPGGMFHPDNLEAISLYLSQPLLPYVGNLSKKLYLAPKKGESYSSQVIESLLGFNMDAMGPGEFEQREQYRDPKFRLDPKERAVEDAVRAIVASGENMEAQSLAIHKLQLDNPDYIDVISTQFSSETRKKDERSKKTREMRTQIINNTNLQKRDIIKAQTNVRKLIQDNPSEKYYIDKQLRDQSNRRNGDNLLLSSIATRFNVGEGNKLIKELSRVGYYPTVVQKPFPMITPKDYANYIERVDKETKKQLEEVINSQNYSTMNKATQEKKLAAAMRKARKIVRENPTPVIASGLKSQAMTEAAEAFINNDVAEMQKQVLLAVPLPEDTGEGEPLYLDEHLENLELVLDVLREGKGPSSIQAVIPYLTNSDIARLQQLSALGATSLFPDEE